MSLFVDINPETIVPELVTDFENRLGVVLKAGDQRREFLQGFGYALTTVLQSLETSGLKELLRTTFGEYMDELGDLVGVTRLPADYADCTVPAFSSCLLCTLPALTDPFSGSLYPVLPDKIRE